jgi:hypothetical protein
VAAAPGASGQDVIPHKFINSGHSRANLVCIHANPTFDTEWLE